jgi:hypothetical protein
MRRLAAATVAACVAIAIGSPALTETEEPREVPPDVCDIAAVADPVRGTVTITWSGGTPPFTIVRSRGEDLSEERLEVLASARPGFRSTRHAVR